MGNICCASKDTDTQQATPAVEQNEQTKPKGPQSKPAKEKVKVLLAPETIKCNSGSYQDLRPSQWVQDIIDQGAAWTDPEFPPNDRSLAKGHSRLHQNYEWKRCGDIFQNPKIFSEGIKPSDVNQGGLGDCYYLCALSSIAEYPDRVKSCFRTQEVNKAGIYEMIFYVGGVKTSVVVDDHVPVTRSGYVGEGLPGFCTTSEEELWAILMEKAWAKLHGDFECMEGGKPGMALHVITGFPVYEVNHDEARYNTTQKESLWRTMKQADQSDYSICCGTDGQGEQDQGMGIVSGHAYSLISVYEADGRVPRLVKIRNPWGKGEWKGDYSDNSRLWTQELSSKLGHVQEEDGTFFMPFDDYLQHYGQTGIAMKVKNQYTCDSLTYYKDGAQSQQQHRASFDLTLNQGIADCVSQPIAIEVIQRGEKLSKYRANNGFQEAVAWIQLLDGYTTVMENMMPCLPLFDMGLIVDQGNLQANKTYTIKIIVQWNESYSWDEDNGSVMLKVNSPVGFTLSEQKQNHNSYY